MTINFADFNRERPEVVPDELMVLIHNVAETGIVRLAIFRNDSMLW